jgi:hypothetical protein
MLFSLVGCGSQTTSNGPVTISFWVRSADEGFVQTVVNAYNATHKNHVALTIIMPVLYYCHSCSQSGCH